MWVGGRGRGIPGAQRAHHGRCGRSGGIGTVRVPAGHDGGRRQCRHDGDADPGEYPHLSAPRTRSGVRWPRRLCTRRVPFRILSRSRSPGFGEPFRRGTATVRAVLRKLLLYREIRCGCSSAHRCGRWAVVTLGTESGCRCLGPTERGRGSDVTRRIRADGRGHDIRGAGTVRRSSQRHGGARSCPWRHLRRSTVRCGGTAGRWLRCGSVSGGRVVVPLVEPTAHREPLPHVVPRQVTLARHGLRFRDAVATLGLRSFRRGGDEGQQRGLGPAAEPIRRPR